MSTAGKVLVVLVTLALLVWLILFSMTAQLYRSWGEKIDTQEKELTQIKADVATAAKDLANRKNAIAWEQASLDRQLTELRIRRADAAKALATTLETLSRYQILAKDAQATLEQDQAAVARRTQERDALKKELADTQSLVTTLKGENAELLAQLTKLQKTFQTTLAENKQMLGRVPDTRASDARRARSL